MMARKAPAKAEAVARARIVEVDTGKYLVEIVLATHVVEEKRMHVLLSKLMKDVGRNECEVMAMDDLDVDFAYRKLNVKERKAEAHQHD